jgi:hypothetical protein
MGVGNYARSRCSTAVYYSEIASVSLKIAKFPVKFPVSREFVWRLVRSALPRQPGSPKAGDFSFSNGINGRRWWAFANWRAVLQSPNLNTSRAKLPKVSGEYLKYSRFRETAAGDRVRSKHCVPVNRQYPRFESLSLRPLAPRSAFSGRSVLKKAQHR